LNLLYEDRLDGRIDAEMYDRKATDIREQLERIQKRILSGMANPLAPMAKAGELIMRTSKGRPGIPGAVKRRTAAFTAVRAEWGITESASCGRRCARHLRNYGFRTLQIQEHAMG
jgi:hypothetical protein